MTDKEELINIIKKKESDLYQAQRASEAWSKSKYKKQSSNTLHSQILVKSLREEIAKLYSQLN